MRPCIIQPDEQIGFRWTTTDGVPTTLTELVVDDDEPERLAATHLSALDDELIGAARRFGEFLGGGARPAAQDRADLAELYRSLDDACLDYARAVDHLGAVPDARAGKIIGTSVLMSILARQALDMLGPVPLDGALAEPTPGVVGGYGEMVQADPARPWRGGRWVVRTESGARLPLTLSMLLFDSSGTNKDAARTEHCAAMQTVVRAAEHPDADPYEVACALDWLLYDYLMAHRDGPDSAEIVFATGRDGDAGVVVTAAAASVTARATFDPALGLRPG
ncbi:hypothetical protein [Mycobacterium sp. SMC-4]|uniref:hypothetical protein n=1 Tax=Mycobacterium sp. SMC-4 TaxID=2857059 RepID=UPI0021B1BBCD|nr:hypothetical protein [Mycobacterium sp. SMC-4]UXA19944.1 hypothetical protein KXD98_10320 [Mycobacterium sp. SMC-4]